MQNKRGQFYIVTAVIIVLVVIGMASIDTQVYVNPVSTTVYELGVELNQEGSKIIDYGIYNGQDTNLLLSGFIEEEFADYFLKKTKDTEISFVYGNETELSITNYNTTNRGDITFGGSKIKIKEELISKKKINPNSKKVKVKIEDRDYDFDLNPGQNFYFLIKYKEGEEILVKKSSKNIK